MPKKKYVIKEETRQRCEIQELTPTTAKRFTALNVELFNYLKQLKSVDFSIYFKLNQTMIEYMKPKEFGEELLAKIEYAMQQDYDGLELCIRKADRARFQAALDQVRKTKIDALIEAEPYLDRKVISVFADLSGASQLIVKGGIDKSVAAQVEQAASFMMDNLMDSETAIATLSKMVIHDPTLYDHSASVAMIAGVIASQHLKKPLPPKEAKIVTQCGLYHDVGKTCIPSHILNKPGKFTPEEFEIMKTHAALGEQELTVVTEEKGVPIHPLACRVAGEHHERWDGRGYPNGRKGRFEDNENEGIHLFSRIVTIADVYSALLMKRVYKEAYEAQDAILLMAKIAEEDYDPEIFPLFLKGVVNSLNSQEKQKSSRGRILLFDDKEGLREVK